MITTSRYRAQAAEDLRPLANGLTAGRESLRAESRNLDDERCFPELPRRRAEEDDKRRFVASLRRLGGG